MNTKQRKKPLNYLFIILGIICLLTLVSSSATLAQGNGPTIRKIRVLKVNRAGVQNPAGLTFSPEANAFYVVEGRGPGRAPPAITNIIKMTSSANRAGSTRIAAALKDPINVAYDSRFKRLLIFQTSSNRLLEVPTDKNGELDPSKMIGHDMRYLNIQNPQGLTVDPDSGDIFILDSAGPQLIHIEPQADGGFDQADNETYDLSETDLVNPRGLAFDPSTGHLQVLNLVEQELYELSQSGHVVTTRNLVALDLSNPQGMVFAPSSDSTDDPATMNLYVAESGLDSGTQGQQAGSGEIVELSLGGSVSVASQSSLTLNTATATSILDVRVAASSDDAEERTSGHVSLTSTDLELVFDSGIQMSQTVGMRFNGLPIPQGSVITNAYVQFQVDETSSDTTNLNIVGEASDNAATFVSSGGNITSRPTTNASVAWSPVPWTTIGEAGPDQQTPDITPVIQEIVNRPGWASGNSVVVIINGSGKRVAESYDGDQAGAPLLHIEYSSTGNHNPGVLINTPVNGSTFNTGNTISFSGTASDFEDGDLTANLVWTSDLDGQIGSGGSFSRSDLSVGMHTITATVTDSGGFVGFNTTQITVFANTNILVGAGDIANDGAHDEATATLLETIPGTVVTLGDNAYPNGTVDDYNNYYDPTWGRHKARTMPATGNHEYDTGTAAAYFNYFGAVAGDPSQGYYSFDKAGWHIIVLNSECSEVGGCGTTDPQGQWLQADLAANPRACTLAIWHKPMFSSGFVSSAGQDFWTLLYQAGADVILNGHVHNYERFAPQDPNGVADPNGIREFVVGTGGAGHTSLSDPRANNSVVSDNTAWGVLKLTLHPASYDWEFIPVAGQTFTDMGSAACVTSSTSNNPPVATDDSFSTGEDTPLNIPAPGVLGNDSDVDGDPLAAVLVSDVSNGSLNLNPDGSFDYTPTPNFNGSDSFTYLANDGTDDSNVATVTITVSPVNDPPVANDDAYTTDEDTTLNVTIPGVLGNDSDVDGDPLTAVLDGGPANGTLTLNPDGSFNYTPNTNFSGTDTFSYHANDGMADSNVATVAITVNAVNSPPSATDDTYTTNEDTTLNVAVPGVLGNDSDPDGDTLTAVLDGGPTNGTLALNSDGSFSYTPDANFNGADSFSYHANDGTADSNVATVSITVNPVNDAPVTVDDAYTTNEDTLLNVVAPGVLTNDSDVDGDPLAAVLDTAPSNGSLTLNPDGSFSYTPDANFNGTDSFSYHANDGTADSNVATVTITVSPVNDPPTAMGDSYTTAEDTPLNVPAPGVLGNDSDPDGDPLNAVLDTPPTSGTLTLNPDGSFSYTPDANFNGSDSFSYHANDGQADSNTATVTITVNPVNDPPTAMVDSYTTAEDTTLNVPAPGVLGNDSDPDGDPLNAVLDTPPTSGTLTLNPDGSFSYTPNANFNGSDTFSYHANDGTADSNTVTVTITVNPVNDPPTAVDDSFTTDEDTTLNVAAPGVLANDSDPENDPLTATLVSDVSNGSLSLNSDGSFSYTPNANFNSTDSFTYTANDGTADSNVATVTITVNPVNDPPTATDDAYTTNEDTPLNISAPGVLANDSDPDGDPLTAVLDGGPANGTLALNSDGSFSYTPNANFNGSDIFSYHANDGTADSNIATVTITVNPVNDAPVTVDDAYTTNEDTPLNISAPGVLTNDSDPDGDPLTAVLDGGPANGTLTLNSDGSFSYTPNANFNGTDSFSYHANDGTADSNTATVTITVNPVNDPPVATDDSYSTNEDTPLNISAPGVLANDSDPDGDPLTAVLDGGPANGTLTLNSDGSFSYTPDTNFNGTDIFSYHANDGTADSNIATVTITVNLVNNPPTAADDAYTTNEDTPLNISAPGVLTNDSDVDGDPLNAVLDTAPSNGSLTLNSDGSFNYTPNANFNGTDNFSYHANDGTADSNVATVSITVNPVNDAPVTVDDAYTTNEDTLLNVVAPGVLTNDSDVDGDPLTAVLNTPPSNGSLTLNSDGSFSYTPDANFNGTDSFGYHANDGTADSNVATVTITVNAVNNPPTAADDTYSTNEDTPLNVSAPGVLANDSDPDGDPLTAVLDGGPANGTLTLNPDGSFNYTPDANFNGTDSFTYTANDGQANSNIATVNITVNPVNDPPSAMNDSYSTAEDTTLNEAAPGVLTNDSDVDGDPLTAVLDGGPANGTLALNPDGSFSYTPNANFNGTDSFSYHANDGTADSNTATVTITVNPVNDPPTAADDAYTTNEDTPLNISAPGVLANDSDPDGDPLTAVLDGGPANGTLALNPDGSFSYTPNANFNGSDSFTYTANDGTADSNTATVTITVNPVNDPPTAVDESYTTAEDTPLNVLAPGVLTNDSDPDGDPLTAVLDGGPANGTLTLNSDGSFSYTPNANFNGSDIFSYHANDGTADSNIATVTITVNPVNDAPVTVDDAYTTNEDTPLNISAPGVLTNDSDPDGDPLTAVLNTPPSNGSLTLNSDGSFTYTPNANFNGTDIFSYHANDGTADSNTATVTITVNAVNNPPTAADDAYTTNEDTPLNISAPGVLTNDSDPENDPLTATLVSSTANGSLNLNPDGSFDYTPTPGFNGSDSFTYLANDGTTDSNVATVTITISPTATTVDALAAGETSVAGTVSGVYSDTYLDDGIAESITEQESGGKPETRYSYLEHKWNFNVTSGNVVSLFANAWSSGSSDGDSFIFAYSTDDVTYTDMFSISNISDGAPLSYVLPPSIQGTVYVRVTDSDHTIGNLTLDTVYVDQLYIRSESQPGSPPAAPSGLSAVAVSVSQINLAWTDNATDEVGFYIRRSEDNNNWSLIDTIGADVTAYTDSNVFPNTTYYYRVQAYNTSGSSGYSNTASATTPNGLNLVGTGYKVKGVQTVDLSWSGSSATSFDVYRDGNLVASGVIGNTYTDNIGLKGAGTYQYQVCEAGSSINCSNLVLIIF